MKLRNVDMCITSTKKKDAKSPNKNNMSWTARNTGICVYANCHIKNVKRKKTIGREWLTFIYI